MFGNILILLLLATVTTAQFEPVADLDIAMYMGRWYQVYKNRFDMTFQGDGTCAVADYNLVNSNITVLNSQIDKDGSLDQITGYAFYKPGNSGGDLTVRLDGVPRSAPYWVIELGPIVNSQYDYAIVSDNNHISLFVLCREVNRYYELYNSCVQESLVKYGFTTTLNKPLIMYQNDCDYNVYG